MAEKLTKNAFMKAMDTIDELNPYATYLNDSTLSQVNEWIDTGSMVLNALISGSVYKGIPVGRVTQFVGASQTFKTGFILQILANAQRMGKYVVIFDSEGAIDPESAASFGLDLSKTKYVPMRSLEETRNAIYNLGEYIKTNKLEGNFIIAVDSLATGQSELELKRMSKDNTSADMGTYAKSVKSLLKTATTVANFTKTPIVCTNWIYDDPAALFPSLEKNIPGGRGTIYLPSVTVQLARKLIKDDEANKLVNTKLAASQKSYSGVIIRILTVKNRFIKQYLEGEVYLSFSTGMNKYYGLLELFKGMGVVTNSGAYYTDWEGNKLGTYKSFIKDYKLLDERLIPELDSRIMNEWRYGNLLNDEAPMEDDGEEEEEGEETEVPKTPVTPLDALKNLKKKVSAKLDELEAEEKKDNDEVVE